jgi:hypothetical protein
MHPDRQTDRQTNRHTERQIDGQTDIYWLAAHTEGAVRQADLKITRKDIKTFKYSDKQPKTARNAARQTGTYSG